MIKVSHHAYWLHKSGNRATDYEDAFWPYWQQKTQEGYEIRFAIADGATESSFARLWARMLTQSYYRFAHRSSALDADFRQTIQKLGKRWSKRVFTNPLEWFVLEKVQRGGHATLLGITLTSVGHKLTKEGSWEALGIGDTCLFQLRNGHLVQAFPLTYSYEFGNHPALLSTMPAHNELIWQTIEGYTAKGQWQSGDDFLLMTDALAAWFLKASENGEQPWQKLAEVTVSQDAFEAWITELRRQDAVRNDDVTLIHIHICE